MKKCQPRALTPYLDGEVSDDARREIDEHLVSCPTCGTQLEELSHALEQVSSMGRAKIPRTSLTPALEIFIERAGLTDGSVLSNTTEIARAAPAVMPIEVEPEVAEEADAEPVTALDSEVEVDALGKAWSPIEPTDAAPSAAAIPDAAFWGTPTAKLTPAEVAPEAELSAAAGEHESPTWVEPERWETAEVSEPAVEPEAAAPDLEVLTSEPEQPTAGAELVDPVDHLQALEEHPSPPPPEIRPPWMESTTADEEDLELAGRRAVDEAIGPVEEPVRSGVFYSAYDEAALAEASPAESSGFRTDWTSVPSAPEVEAEPELGPPSPDEPSTDGAEPRRGWLSSLFRNREQTTADADSPPSHHDELQPALSAEPAEPVDVPEAERLMWITPRPPVESVTQPVESTDEPGAAPPEDSPAQSEIPDDEQLELESEPVAAMAAGGGDDPAQVRSYREALLGARADAADGGGRPGSLNTQLKVGLIGALVIIVVVAAVLAFARGGTHPASTASTNAHPTTASHPTPAASPSHSTAPSAAPSPAATTPAVGQLTEIVSAGAGGSAWRVKGIRIGSPNAATGITRVVFDLEGAGPPPNAQLGRGKDGAVYLTAAGIDITQAIVSGFSSSGAITGITQSGSQGLAIRIATNGSPGFSIGYLGTPNRLVLDFK